MIHEIIKRLPGANCGGCGFSRCDEFADALLKHKSRSDECVIFAAKKNLERKYEIDEILTHSNFIDSGERCKKLAGVIDHYEADFILEPLDHENSCREVLLPMSAIMVDVNEIVKYRPLGCPIVHYAEVIKKQSLLLTVKIIGPCERLGNEFHYHDVGLCMVIGFEGKHKCSNIRVGDTVRFLPQHCMMQKVHSGVVVELTNDRVVIEGIDLKVWSPPIVIK